MSWRLSRRYRMAMRPVAARGDAPQAPLEGTRPAPASPAEPIKSLGRDAHPRPEQRIPRWSGRWIPGRANVRIALRVPRRVQARRNHALRKAHIVVRQEQNVETASARRVSIHHGADAVDEACRIVHVVSATARPVA